LQNVRKRFVIKGNVQGVGYRVLVKHIARSLGIVGYAKNLDDGSVEIYAQANPKTMAEFIRKVSIKSEKGGFFSPHVDSITEFSESDKSFRPAKEGFGASFWVSYGGKLSHGERELIEKTEIGSMLLSELKGETMGFREETKENLTGLKTATKGFSEETKGSFSTLDRKYDSVSDYLRKINENLEKIGGVMARLADKMP